MHNRVILIQPKTFYSLGCIVETVCNVMLKIVLKFKKNEIEIRLFHIAAGHTCISFLYYLYWFYTIKFGLL